MHSLQRAHGLPTPGFLLFCLPKFWSFVIQLQEIVSHCTNGHLTAAPARLTQGHAWETVIYIICSLENIAS